MTQHTITYESLSSHENAGGSVRPDAGFAQSANGILDIAGRFYLVPSPIVPPSGYDALPVAAADIVEVGDTTLYTRAFPNGNAVQGASVVTAAGNVLIRNNQSDSGVNTGRVAPQILVDMNLVTQPANPVSANVVLQYAYSDSLYQGVTHFCEFEDRPPNTASDGGAKLQELLNTFATSKSSYQVGANASGTPIVINQCGFAALAPEGAVWIRPEDLGVGPDQIPAGVFDNTAAKFRAHPSVFYPSGKTPYVRAITRQAADPFALDEQVANIDNISPLAIWQVDAAPNYSNWLVVVDGQAQIVKLTHPAGSDYRRPRDIYNALWVPILTGASNIASAQAFGSVVGSNDAVAFRWQYADYLRCLPLPGTTSVLQFGAG